ncbi:hypothetical protein [Kordiimonas aestuarii]|uniref:hypothetical protein n=1 Tax=Kordiimonas aestuarii TaxID=1005925 RepID=UPI0021D01138|nr:hypothetical protein [Kordiimonas aestuarii]
MTTGDYIRCISGFLNSIGIPVLHKALPDDTFLPGIRIEHGSLAIAPNKLKHPGDMLHEAGHIASMAPSARKTAFADAGGDMGEEIAAQAWSYAASVACGIPAEIVLHQEGYKGSATWLKEHYEGKECIAGLPLLAWYGLTSAPGMPNHKELPAFPAMGSWLRAHDNPSQAP